MAAEDESERTWRYFWHPVCTLNEFRGAHPDGKGPFAVSLLDQKIVVAELQGQMVAMQDRCVHRSASLSLGCVEERGLRCAYHGWLYNGSGHCIEIPSCPDSPIPRKAKLAVFETEVRYDLIWVRMEAGAATSIPGCPAWDDPTFKVVSGEPYTWPTSAGRRLENFVDLAHFPFVHDGTLGSRQHTETPMATIDRVDGELRFSYDPPTDLDLPDVALMAETRYRIFMPFAVNLEFLFPENDSRNMLWMCASPVTANTCRSFWFTCRDAGRDDPDQPHLDFQDVVLGEDLPIVASQDPPGIPPRGFEVSVSTDKVSRYYREWLYEMVATEDPAELSRIIATAKADKVPLAHTG